MGMSITQLILALTLIGMGVLTYYVAPLTFIYKNYAAFFMILNFVLILMILGLSFLSLLILPWLQRQLVSVFLCFKPSDRTLKSLINKNLSSHEQRNTKTAMMFVIALSFLIFAGCVFELMGRLIISQLEISMGGVDLYASSVFSPTAYLDDLKMSQFLEEQRAYDGAIDSYTFVATDMADLLRTLAPNANLQQKILFGTACGFS